VTVIAAHPDDAQLAVGGLLAGCAGAVIDVFSHETWTRRPYYRARPELTAKLLVAEERVACTVLGCHVELLGHTEATGRAAWQDGFFVSDPATAGPTVAEPALLARLTAQIGARLPGAGPVLAPLAVGGHADHVLTREAVLGLLADGTLDRQRVAFYEDMPYSVLCDPAPLAASLARRPAVGPLRPVTVPAAAHLADLKREALWAYRLQVPEGLADRVLRYGAQLAAHEALAERLWLPDRSRAVEFIGTLG
jgi:LmbE family N-acetylglucosaminyl deacetylase